ncbi:MAG: hypothetical protein QXH03_09575 [Candidatus Bathyarchaeia archaeon]
MRETVAATKTAMPTIVKAMEPIFRTIFSPPKKDLVFQVPDAHSDCEVGRPNDLPLSRAAEGGVGCSGGLGGNYCFSIRGR